ncbi:MAG: fibro-slime domain-containing protein [Deltaproteobacteria bacterium]|nr:fibro-slime domain-containing protein [Deltaproteobacteria bacterium]
MGVKVMGRTRALLGVFAISLALLGFGPACSFDANHKAGTGPGPTGDGGLPQGDFPIRNNDAFVSAPDVPAASDAGPCSQVLRAVVRDFRGWPGMNGEPKHPDFENGNAVQKGIAAEMLGADSKPVYGLPGPTPVSTGPAEYGQWYRDVPEFNVRSEIDIALTPDPARAGTFVYDNDVFFPLDNMAFGNQGRDHNFHFTTEVHFDFPYRGGEVFTFRGDDDLWLFVNGHLAIDLGGVHGAMTGTVNLDADAAKLGITPGQTYRMDIFHAERHTSRSTYHIETTLQCIVNIPIP